MPRDPEALLAHYAEIKNEHDVEGMLALTHPDCQYEEVGTARIVTGIASLRDYHQRLFAAMPDYHATMDGMAASGATAVAWGKFAGRLAAPLFGIGVAGQQIQTSAVFICEFRDGLLHRERAHIDLLTLQRQTRTTGRRPDRTD